MAKKPLHYISDQELKKAFSRARALTVIQGILVAIMAVFGVLATVEAGMSIFTFLPLFFLPMVIMGIIQMRQFKAEMKRREES